MDEALLLKLENWRVCLSITDVKSALPAVIISLSESPVSLSVKEVETL